VDADVARLGYRDCLNIANHIVFKLQEQVAIGRLDPVLGKMVYSFGLADDPIHFMEIVDPFKDFFPYYICGLEAHFWVPAATPSPPIPTPAPSMLEGGTEGWYETKAMPVGS
jgi:hypothetical protein